MKLTHALAVAGASVLAAPALAQTVWTDWTSAAPSSGDVAGSAGGTLNGVVVSYSGEVLGNTVTNGGATNWNPASSFVGGTVSVSPDGVGDIITLAGSFGGTSTLSFSAPVVNPVFAIWSLGRPGSLSSFVFDAAPTFQVGGPNAQFGGSAIMVDGNTVNGAEGNGVVQFTGTFSSISWTNTPEFFYGFTVGTTGSVAAIPEPSSAVLMLLGLAGVAHLVRRSRAAH